jgi:hypothetical protein
MKIKVLAAMTAAFAAGTSAGQKLDVFVANNERIPFVTLQRTELLASRMFASADVRIAWHGLAPSGWKGQNRVIIIQLELATPAAYHLGALGCSLPNDGQHVSIFYDRIRRMDQQNLEPFLLAHAMVHEITHALQGMAHSATGVMKAHWDSADYIKMMRNLLTFPPKTFKSFETPKIVPLR